MESININNLAEECMKEIKNTMENLKKLNIVIIGKSGVGKSTLINAVFRENLATTGIGTPVTQRMQLYTKRNFPLAIYDTKGFELGKEAQEEVKNELIEQIKKGIRSGDINDTIHCMWYCINTQSNRFEPEEIQWIKDFRSQINSYKIPIIIVLTMSYSKSHASKMQKVIEKENLDVCKVLPVLALDYEVDENYTVPAYGLDKLIEIMEETLPDELADTLMSVQQANLELKRKKALSKVTAAAVAAAAAAASPIPFSDSAVLIPIEVTMIASITAIFGFEFNKSVLTALISSVFGVGSATIAGKTIVSGLLKMIPGVGTLAGAAISAGTASTLTTALGKAYIGIMTLMFNGELKEKDLETKAGRDKLGELFHDEMKKN